MLERIPAGSTEYRFPDLAFGLNDQAFQAWWSTALLAEDASEYVSFHHGSLDGARFVCALKYFSGPGRRDRSSDLIVQAYLLCKNLPTEYATRVKYKHEAQLLYESDPVQWLLEKLSYRGERLERERVSLRTAEKIHELFDRTRTPQSDDEAAEIAMKSGMPQDYEKKLATEKLALDAGIRFMSVGTKEKTLEDSRRDKRSMQRAIEENEMKSRSAGKAPTSVEEAKLLMLMLKEAFGPEQFTKIVAEVEPKALTDGE